MVYHILNINQKNSENNAECVQQVLAWGPCYSFDSFSPHFKILCYSVVQCWCGSMDANENVWWVEVEPSYTKSKNSNNNDLKLRMFCTSY
jgi:hypothetical protein